MRNWMIFAVIICLLSTLVICESQINKEFFSKSTKLIDRAEEKILKGQSAESEIDELINVLDNNKVKFYVFYSHNILNNFEECLLKISVVPDVKDGEMLRYHIAELRNINDMFKNYHKLKIGNVF